MAKCKNCRNLYNLSDENDFIVGKWCPKIEDNPDIEIERECRHYKVMIKADWVRSMTDEELADFLSKQFFHETGKELLIEWLKQNVEE